jgi:hypothetical protein
VEVESSYVGFYMKLFYIVSNLQNLRVLILGFPCEWNDEQLLGWLYGNLEADSVGMIGKYCENLEYLKIWLKDLDADETVARLKEHLPGLRGSVEKEVRGRTVTTEF